jgi:hypothetical protein
MRNDTRLRKFAIPSRYPKPRCTGISRLGKETSNPQDSQTEAPEVPKTSGAFQHIYLRTSRNSRLGSISAWVRHTGRNSFRAYSFNLVADMTRSSLGCVAITEQDLRAHRISELDHRNIGITSQRLELAIGGGEEVRHTEDASGTTVASVARQVQLTQAQALDCAIRHFSVP